LNDLQVKLKAENCAIAEIKSVSDQHVILVVEATDKWNAEGLLKLSALLQGIAATLVAALMLGSALCGAADAVIDPIAGPYYDSF
jgi:hypothetical protein